MKIKVWLDDIRVPQESYIWVKTVPHLIMLIESIGDQISEISLDNDLGKGLQEGYTFLDWLEEKIFTGIYTGVPKLRVHSRNPVAKKRMEAGIRSILKRIKENESAN